MEKIYVALALLTNHVASKMKEKTENDYLYGSKIQYGTKNQYAAEKSKRRSTSPVSIIKSIAPVVNTSLRIVNKLIDRKQNTTSIYSEKIRNEG